MNLSVFLDRSFSLVNLMCFQINIAINQSDLRGKLPDYVKFRLKTRVLLSTDFRANLWVKCLRIEIGLHFQPRMLFQDQQNILSQPGTCFYLTKIMVTPFFKSFDFVLFQRSLLHCDVSVCTWYLVTFHVKHPSSGGHLELGSVSRLLVYQYF